MAPLLASFRTHFRDDDSMARDNMGDPAALLPRLIPALRLFVAYNWSGNEFQRQLIGYGCNVVSATVERCTGTNRVCPYFGKEIKYFNHGSNKAVLVLAAGSVLPVGSTLLDMTDEGASKQQLNMYEGDRMVLADELANMHIWSGRWHLMSGQKCTGCDELRIVQQHLVTLPFMLYINTFRSPALSKPAQLRYDPNELVIGPTQDGHYATYRLVCRLEKVGAHYVADVRMLDGTFTQYDFNMRISNRKIPAVDTGCAYLVWQRVDK